MVTETITCVHRWVIAPPEGPTSEGKCLNCGDTRTFRNSVKGAEWSGAVSVVPSTIDAALALARRRHRNSAPDLNLDIDL